MRISWCAAGVAALLLLAGCTGAAGNDSGESADDTPEVQQDAEFGEGTTMAELAQAGTITVGTTFDQPGWALRQPGNDAPEGFDVEIATMIADGLGITPGDIQWKETVAADRETFLEDGRVDIVVGTYTITDPRKERVDFAGPYYVAGQDIMVNAGNPEGIGGPESLSYLNVCSVEGSTAAQNILDNYGDAQLTLFDDYSACADALARGEVNAVTGDDVVLAGLVAASEGAYELVGNPFTEEPYGIGVRKGDEEFRAYLNDALEQSVEDGWWQEAWDRTAGALTGAVAPEPPAVDRY